MFYAQNKLHIYSNFLRFPAQQSNAKQWYSSCIVSHHWRLQCTLFGVWNRWKTGKKKTNIAIFGYFFSELNSALAIVIIFLGFILPIFLHILRLRSNFKCKKWVKCPWGILATNERQSNMVWEKCHWRWKSLNFNFS